MLHARYVIVLALALTVGLGAYASGEPEQERIDPLTVPFEEVIESARGTTVSFFMWGGSDMINAWIDGFVSDRMRELYDIEVDRVPMDAAVFVNKLLTELQAGRQVGTTDLMWINGENFRNAKEADLLFGPFAELLPNYQNYVDPQLAATDAGFPVEGFESPYGKAQFNFDYDTARVTDPPQSFADLSRWVREHPGRFTYPQPPDFTGSAFIRQAFYAITGGWQQYADGFDQSLFDRNAPALWTFLNDIEPFLWERGETYPRDLAALDGLFERGEVDITMSFTQTNAASRIANGRYPATVRSFVMEDGSLFNTHFVAIAFNAPNPAGAMVLANFLLSPEAQLSKNRVENWGDFTVLDLNRLSDEDRAAFEALDLGAATVPIAELDRAGVPEIPSEYWEALEAGWDANVRLR